MNKILKKLVSAAVAVGMVLPVCVMSVSAEQSVTKCYADTDEIIITYSDEVSYASDIVLTQGGSIVETNAKISGNTVTLTPADGEFVRDKVYKISAGSYSEYFRIKTVVDGITSSNISRNDGTEGNSWGGGVFVGDGYYTLNAQSGIKNDEMSALSDYTVKYSLELYMQVAERPAEGQNVTPKDRVYHWLCWNNTSAGGIDGYGILFDYEKNTPSSVAVSALKTTNGGRTSATSTDVFAEDCYIDKNDYGVILWNGTDNVEVLTTAVKPYSMKLVKSGALGSVYVDKNFIYTYSPSGESLKTTGYFSLGSSDSGGIVSGIKNMLVTTYERVTVSEIAPVSYYADSDAVTVAFDGELADADYSTGFAVMQNGSSVPVTAEADGNTLVIKPASGKFARDVETRLDIEKYFGSETVFTEQSYSKSFVIKTIQDEINSDTFNASGTWKNIIGDSLYVYNNVISPKGDHSNLNDYSVSFKLKPYLEASTASANLYLRIGLYEPEADKGVTNGWNLQNYDASFVHIVNGASDWGTSYESIVNMGIPSKDSLGVITRDTSADPYFTVTTEGSYAPAEFKVVKHGTHGVLSAGTVSNEFVMQGDSSAGYFTIQNAAQKSVFVISEFIMTTYEELNGDVSVINTESKSTDTSYSVTYAICKNGSEASYPAWIVLAAYDENKVLLGAAAKNYTVTHSVTGETLTISDIENAKIDSVKMFVWDSSSGMRPYEPIIVIK